MGLMGFRVRILYGCPVGFMGVPDGNSYKIIGSPVGFMGVPDGNSYKIIGSPVGFMGFQMSIHTKSLVFLWDS